MQSPHKEPVRSEEPDVAEPTDRVDRSVRYVIGIRQPLVLCGGKSGEFRIREANQREVKAQGIKVGDLQHEDLLIPPRILGQLIVGEHVRLALRLGYSRATMTGASCSPSLPGGKHAAVAGARFVAGNALGAM